MLFEHSFFKRFYPAELVNIGMGKPFNSTIVRNNIMFFETCYGLPYFFIQFHPFKNLNAAGEVVVTEYFSYRSGWSALNLVVLNLTESCSATRMYFPQDALT